MPFFDPATETLPRPDLRALQLGKLQTLIGQVAGRNRFYTAKWQAAGVEQAAAGCRLHVGFQADLYGVWRGFPQALVEQGVEADGGNVPLASGVPDQSSRPTMRSKIRVAQSAQAALTVCQLRQRASRFLYSARLSSSRS